jgi:predicted RNA methylase
MRNEEIRKAWNERVGTTSAHIIIDKWLGDYKTLTENYNARILKKIDWTGKTVIDYGTGGGWCGKYLFEEKGISKYIGFDIAPRSIEHARATLNGRNAELNLILTIPDFKEYKADVFLCLAVIRHFPDKPYTDEFFQKLNRSKFKTLAISYRDGLAQEYQKSPYKTTSEIAHACKLTIDDVKKYLPKYELTHKTDPDAVGQCYCIFEKKQRVKD